MMLPISTEEKLQERVKELSCLYNISSILLGGSDTNKMLQEIAFVVKQAWRFCDDATVEMQIDQHYILSNPLPENTVWQHAPIVLSEIENGFIKVHYDSNKFTNDYFLSDELLLLQAIASKIGAFYEKKATDEALKILQLGMQRADRLNVLGEITAGIAHELNTPLGTILGFAELIKERTQDEQISHDIDKVINASIFSREIVKKLMFFSCEMPYNLQSISIKPIVEQALRFLEPNFRKKGLTCHFQMENPTLEVQIDSVQFTQVLFNLLVNAIYASADDSQITITITSNSVFYFIEIADEGDGIPDAIVGKIFEPFFTTKPTGEGTGLGLSVVHGIVKSHRGEITAVPNQPKGTIFRIKLPIVQMI